jgi:tyrosine-protein phosphatase SIW14
MNLLHSSRLLGVVLVLGTVALGQGPCVLDFPHDSNPTPIVDSDICNFHKFDEGFYRGGRPRASAFSKLFDLGIRTIIDLEQTESAEQERGVVEKLNQQVSPDRQINFISFPITPEEMENEGVSHQRMQELFLQIQQARRPIFIHCYHGKDRTGAVVAIYRLRLHQMTYDEAYQEARHYLFGRGDLGLRKTVDRYTSEKKLLSLPAP